ncbi:MAG TPA: hypothetical protein VNK41_04735 [Vicinamibacterales bacterium]|nr:hypothetical protein [Vicinamibacterales bacterium]
MRQALRNGALALLLVATGAPPASAGWGWLERLSGPGPFNGFQYAFPIACYGWRPAAAPEDGDSGQAAQAGDSTFRFEPVDWDCRDADPRQMRVVFGVDFARLSTDDNPFVYRATAGGKPGVNALLVVPYASVPIGIAFEAGAGAGFVRFTDRGGDIDFSTTKLLLQPVRLTFKPLALFSDSTRWEAFQLALNGTLIPQEIEDVDFGAVPTGFRESSEFLWQVAFRVDVVKLLLPEKSRKRGR